MAKRRVLIVDDEAHVLRGLRRMLRPMRVEWEMQFASSGPEALRAFTTSPIDVIVSDMRMPGMDGAELLTEVRRQHPETVRIALSGQSDQGTILRSVGPTHQFLSKPCDPETLKATVRRACALRDALDSSSLKRVVAELGSLPSPPASYRDLIEELQDEEPSIYRLREIIGNDPAMSAKVLQLVNSAFFGNAQRVTSATEAATLLGAETIKALALSVQAFAEFEPGASAPDIDELWRHSVTTATYARAIASSELENHALVDEAMTAGLLHDIGRLVLMAHLPSEYRSVVEAAKEEQAELWEVEQRELGATHAAIGAYLLGIWGLPDSIVQAVAYHHHPNESPGFGFSPLTVVHVANALEHEIDGRGSLFPPSTVDHHYVTRLGLADRLPRWRETCIDLRSSRASQ